MRKLLLILLTANGCAVAPEIKRPKVDPKKMIWMKDRSGETLLCLPKDQVKKLVTIVEICKGKK